MSKVESKREPIQVDNNSEDDSSSTSSSGASPLASREPSSSDLKSLAHDDAKPKAHVTLKDRSKIPNSLYLSLSLILTAHMCGNIWSVHVISNWANSMQDAWHITVDVLKYLHELTLDALQGKVENWFEFGQVCAFTALVGCMLYVLLIAPLRAGFWTGSRSTKHKMHRYMGLAYLFQYYAAWTQYLAHYESAKDSYLPHFIALNGRCSTR
jgi:hypothetical protein